MSKPICIKKCDQCGKSVEIRHKERLNRKNIFCSKKCESEFKKSTNKNYRPCAICGKLTYKKPSDTKKSKTNILCCSMKCAGELKKTIYLGDKNPNYNNKGINSPLHKKDKRITYQGYVLIALDFKHPFAIDRFWIKEHRYLAEKYLMTDEQSITIDGKKYLNPIYDVHHKDLNKTNNDISNLQILKRSEHMKLHYEIKRRKKNLLNLFEHFVKVYSHLMD